MMGILGLYKTKKSWSGCHHLFLVYDASKLSTVYVVKRPVLGLQWVPENSVFPPSVKYSLAGHITRTLSLASCGLWKLISSKMWKHKHNATD